MEAHEGIENEKPGRASSNGFAKARLIAPAIETETRCRDDMQRNVGEIEPARVADAFEPRLDDGRGVLGHVDEDGAGIVDGERAETRGAAGDGDGKIECEPRFAALRGSAEYADGRTCPERIHEPTRADIAIFEIGGTNDRKRVGVGVDGGVFHAEPTPRSSSAA